MGLENLEEPRSLAGVSGNPAENPGITDRETTSIAVSATVQHTRWSTFTLLPKILTGSIRLIQIRTSGTVRIEGVAARLQANLSKVTEKQRLAGHPVLSP